MDEQIYSEERARKLVELLRGLGARIAAHFANAGLPCVLLDMVPPDLKPGGPGSERNRFARNGIEAAKKSRPAASMLPGLLNGLRHVPGAEHGAALSSKMPEWMKTAGTSAIRQPRHSSWVTERLQNELLRARARQGIAPPPVLTM